MAALEQHGIAERTIGRYTILERVGRGGMGEVFAAYDPKLDRKVALKLLRADRDAGDDAGRDSALLLREAKAMAKVSHPNVVAVHDAGIHGARVFVAMEFVDGPTLKGWLAERPRSRQEILEVFGAAARGLMAAHAAGLVHRDFKPGNVLMSHKGEVRVGDFGLARELGRPRDDAAEGRRPAEPDAGPLQTLTITGDVVGTPKYMAPEQFKAEATDARTDQFAFCVALYQSLYGVGPFGEGDVAALAAAVLAGRVQPPPTGSNVPVWLRRVLLRGLSVAPRERWPSMRDLVDALGRDPARVRRRWALGAGLALICAALVAAAARQDGRRASLCHGGAARLAGVWEPSGAATRRAAVQAAFVASGAPGAGQVWDRVSARLDRYARGWLAMYEDACQATHVRAVQPAHVLDLRMACLDERLTAVAALTRVLAGADRGVVGKSVDAVNALPALGRCADVKELLQPGEAPRDEATRAKVADVRRRLAEAKALNDTGRHTDAAALIQPLLREARATGHRPLIAEALTLLGKTMYGGTGGPEFLAIAEEAVWTAMAVSRFDLAADAALDRIGAAVYFTGDLTSTASWVALASALIERLGPGHDVQRAWLLQGQALLEERQNDPEAALALFRRARALKEKALPAGHPDIVVSLNSEAEELHRLGKNDAALELNQRAYESFLSAYGPESSEAAYTLGNRGEYLLDAGRPAQAVAPLRESVRRWERQIGADNVLLGIPLTALGRALVALDRPKDAVAPLERALRLRRPESTGPELIAETRFALATALAKAGADDARARALAVEARDLYRRVPDAARAAAIEAWLRGSAAR